MLRWVSLRSSCFDHECVWRKRTTHWSSFTWRVLRMGTDDRTTGDAPSSGGGVAGWINRPLVAEPDVWTAPVTSTRSPDVLGRTSRTLALGKLRYGWCRQLAYVSAGADFGAQRVDGTSSEDRSTRGAPQDGWKPGLVHSDWTSARRGRSIAPKTGFPVYLNPPLGLRADENAAIRNAGARVAAVFGKQARFLGNGKTQERSFTGSSRTRRSGSCLLLRGR